MKNKNDYQHFVEEQLQRIQYLEDLSEQFSEQDYKDIMTLADSYGLSMEDLVSLHKPGMNGRDFVNEMKQARRK